MCLILQVCYIHMVLKQFDQKTIELNPDSLVMLSPVELSQYFMTDWQLKYFNESE